MELPNRDYGQEGIDHRKKRDLLYANMVFSDLNQIDLHSLTPFRNVRSRGSREGVDS